MLWGDHGAGGALSGPVWAWLPLIGVSLGSILTVAYTARFMWGAFATKRVQTNQGVRAVQDTEFHTPVSSGQLSPSIVLAVLGVVLAVAPGLIAPLLDSFAASMPPLDADSPALYLALWHGLTPVLGLSLVIVAVGLLLFWAKDPVARLQAVVPAWVDAQRGYRTLLRRVDDVAVWVTGRTQRGSLSFYLFICLLYTSPSPRD